MRILLLMISFFLVFTEWSWTQTHSTREIIEQMIAAHGGMNAWRNANTISFEHILIFGDKKNLEWWVQREMTETTTMRTYQEWLVDSSFLAFDGTRTWTRRWKKENPPKMQVNNHFTAYCLPWLSQNTHVNLSEPTRKSLPDDTTSYFVVTMSFQSQAGFAKEKYYKLFIHPRTFLMMGWEYNLTDGALLDAMNLPASVTAFGPFTAVIEEHRRVDGLLIPLRYRTFNPRGEVSGNHLVLDFAVNKPFDESKVALTPDGVVDYSNSERKSR
jgi:hypothetical protein